MSKESTHVLSSSSYISLDKIHLFVVTVVITNHHKYFHRERILENVPKYHLC